MTPYRLTPLLNRHLVSRQTSPHFPNIKPGFLYHNHNRCLATTTARSNENSSKHVCGDDDDSVPPIATNHSYRVIFPSSSSSSDSPESSTPSPPPPSQPQPQVSVPSIARKIFGWSHQDAIFLANNIPKLNFNKKNFQLLQFLAFQHPKYSDALKWIYRRQKKKKTHSAYVAFMQKNRDAISRKAKEEKRKFLQVANEMWREHRKEKSDSTTSGSTPSKSPKRLNSAFHFFQISIAPHLESVSPKERFSVIAKEWKKLNKSERMIYEMMADEAKLENLQNSYTVKKNKESRQFYEEHTRRQHKEVRKRHKQIQPILTDSHVFSGDVDCAILDLDYAFPNENILDRYLEYLKQSDPKMKERLEQVEGTKEEPTTLHQESNLREQVDAAEEKENL